MTAPHIIDPAGLLGQALGDASLLATQDCLRHRLPDPPSIAAAVTFAAGVPQLRPVKSH